MSSRIVRMIVNFARCANILRTGYMVAMVTKSYRVSHEVTNLGWVYFDFALGDETWVKYTGQMAEHQN